MVRQTLDGGAESAGRAVKGGCGSKSGNGAGQCSFSLVVRAEKNSSNPRHRQQFCPFYFEKVIDWTQVVPSKSAP